MKSKIIQFLFFIFIKIAVSQPPCLPSAGGTPAGNNPPGCALCGPIYQGSTMGYTPSGLAQSRLPCCVIENDQFISVTVDSTTVIQASIQASNCQNNQGVQLVILDMNFNSVSNCFSSEGIDFQGQIIAENLIPGAIYIIMIDGMLGDICDFLVTVSGGVDTGPPDPPGVMNVQPDTNPLCPGAVVCYSIAPVARAVEYEWIIPSNSRIVSGGSPFDTIVCLEYTAPGGGVVRVTPSNACFPGIPAIVPVVVLPILPTFNMPISLCGGSPTGVLDTCYKTDLGCDSCVQQIIIATVPIILSLDAIVCSSECFPIGDSCYLTPGSHTLTLPSNNPAECDTMVFLNIIADKTTSFMDTTICPGDFIQIDSMIFDSTVSRDFFYPQSTYNGCDSTLKLNLIISDLSAPEIFCLQDTFTSGIAINWTKPAGAMGYQLLINDSLLSTQNHNSYLFVPSLNIDSAKIRVVPFNTKGCDFEMAETVCFPRISTQIEENSLQAQVKVFPNPTRDMIEIYSQEKINGVKIFNLKNQLLSTVFENEIDLSNYESGVYFLKIETASGFFIRKVIKL